MNSNGTHIILAYLSFPGSAQLFATAIIDTTLFLKYNGDQIVLRDSTNGQTGYIVRKSVTSISLKTTDSIWQLGVCIY